MIAFLDLLDTAEEKTKFEELYNSYKDLLYWIAFQKVKIVEDAEECVQETFFYVAKNFNKIDIVESRRTKSYLATIVTGFAIDIYNKSIKIDFASNDDAVELYNNEADELKYYESYGKVELLSVFDKALDEEDRVFFYLKYIYGYKSSEIAEMYHIKDSYVRKRLQYSKEKLRKHLNERNG